LRNSLKMIQSDTGSIPAKVVRLVAGIQLAISLLIEVKVGRTHLKGAITLPHWNAGIAQMGLK